MKQTAINIARQTIEELKGMGLPVKSAVMKDYEIRSPVRFFDISFIADFNGYNNEQVVYFHNWLFARAVDLSTDAMYKLTFIMVESDVDCDTVLELMKQDQYEEI